MRPFQTRSGACGAGPAGLRRRQEGFTLIEMMVSLLIFTVVLVMVIPVLLQNAQGNRMSDNKTQAAVAIQQVLDAYRQVDASTLPTSGSRTQTVAAGGRSFTVTATFCAIASLCTGQAHQVTATASLAGTAVLSVETVFTPLNTDTE